MRKLYSFGFLVITTVLVAAVPVAIMAQEGGASCQALEATLLQCQADLQEGATLVSQLRDYITVRETDLLYVIAQSDARQRQLTRVQADLAVARHSLTDRDAQIAILTSELQAPKALRALVDVQATTKRLVLLARKLARGRIGALQELQKLSTKLDRANAHNAEVALSGARTSCP